MRRSGWTPPIVPHGDDHNVYLVMDDFGRLGQVWREADDSAAVRTQMSPLRPAGSADEFGVPKATE